jgi:hypothetical protein
VDFTLTLHERSSDAYTHASAECGSIVEEGDLDPQPGKKGEKLLGVTPFGTPGMCVRFALQG